MGRFHSIILLVSFLVGTLQPILPMIQYQLDGGSIIELMIDQATDSDTNKIVIPVSADDEEGEEIPKLLNGDYYPLALQMVAPLQLALFLHELPLYLPKIGDIKSPYILPTPPPPRLS